MSRGDAELKEHAAGEGRVSTGSPVLDEALDGGLPAQRSTLVIGGPGTGKSTLAMQFLQAGLDQGERCLHISTEQTPEELADSFGDFGFDLDHEDLTLTSVHGVSDRTIEEEKELTIKTLEGGELIDAGVGVPFEGRYLQQALAQHGPVDRVVLDSASGLAALGEDDSQFRRAMLDLIRLFTDELGATSLIVSEGRSGDPADFDETGPAGDELLQFSTHGVLRLWMGDVAGDAHRFVRIEKMRGVDHDARRFKIRINPDVGIQIVPRRRSLPKSAIQHDHFETGVEGLDEFLGGGLARGQVTLLEHDGLATLEPLALALVNQAIQADFSVVILPPVDFRYKELTDHLWGDHPPLETLFDENRLFVIDPIRPPADAHQNVFHVSGDEAYQSALETINERTADRPRFGLLDIDTLLHKLDAGGVERVTREAIATLMQRDDLAVFTLNTNGTNDDLQVFLEDTCQQVLQLWQDPDGLEILKLEKAMTAAPGRSRVIEYVESPPYVRFM